MRQPWRQQTRRDYQPARRAWRGRCDTNGRWDLLAELRAANLAELSQVLERIRLVRGISSTETSIHLQTYRLS